MSNPFKEQLAEKVSVNEEQKRKEEEATIKLLSYDIFYCRNNDRNRNSTCF